MGLRMDEYIPEWLGSLDYRVCYPNIPIDIVVLIRLLGGIPTGEVIHGELDQGGE